MRTITFISLIFVITHSSFAEAQSAHHLHKKISNATLADSASLDTAGRVQESDNARGSWKINKVLLIIFLLWVLPALIPATIANAKQRPPLKHFFRALKRSWVLETISVIRIPKDVKGTRDKEIAFSESIGAEEPWGAPTDNSTQGALINSEISEEAIPPPSLDFLYAFGIQDTRATPGEISSYNQRFSDFVKQFDPSIFMRDGNVVSGFVRAGFGGGLSDLAAGDLTTTSGNTLAEYLENQGRGLFDGISDDALRELSDKLDAYAVEKRLFDEKEEARWKEKELNTARGYLLKTLELERDDLSDGELEFAEIVINNLSGFYIRDGILELPEISRNNPPKKLHKIILDTIRGKGSLFEFVQNWFVIAHRNELILWSADKLDFADILRTYVKENGNDEDENSDLTQQMTPSLTESIGKTTMNGYAGGHDLKWDANSATTLALGSLIKYGFVEDLGRASDDLWSFMFNDGFKKNKLFTDGKINNQEDIAMALDRLRGESTRVAKPQPPISVNTYSSKSVLPTTPTSYAQPEPKKEEYKIDDSIDRLFSGKLYKMPNLGYPIGIYKEGKIYEIANQGYPVGLCKDGKIYKITNQGYPVGVYRDGKIYKVTNQGFPVAVYRNGKLYEVTNQGYPIGIYDKKEEDSGAALAFLLGMI